METENQNPNQQYTTQKPWTLDSFHILDRLGEGQFGYVHKAIEKESGKIVALKKISKKTIFEKFLYNELKREIEIQSRLKQIIFFTNSQKRHKHIVQFYGYFQTTDYIYIVLEFLSGGSLYQYIYSKEENQKGLSEQQVAKFLLQIATGIEYLRKRNVIHRDLKLENILISEDSQLKIADFGCATHTINSQRQTFCGTLEYLSPEMLNHQSQSSAVDTWALGILMYEMLFLVSPFKENTEDQTKQRISNGEINFDHHNRVISTAAKQLIGRLLDVNPQNRIKYEEILTCEFIATQFTRTPVNRYPSLQKNQHKMSINNMPSIQLDFSQN